MNEDRPSDFLPWTHDESLTDLFFQIVPTAPPSETVKLIFLASPAFDSAGEPSDPNVWPTFRPSDGMPATRGSFHPWFQVRWRLVLPQPPPLSEAGLDPSDPYYGFTDSDFAGLADRGEGDRLADERPSTGDPDRHNP